MFASHVRYPRSGLPSQGQHPDHDDHKKESRKGSRPLPERHNSDPCVRILFEEQNREAQNETVEEGSHGAIIQGNKFAMEDVTEKISFNHKGHEVHKGKVKDELRAFDFPVIFLPKTLCNVNCFFASSR